MKRLQLFLLFCFPIWVCSQNAILEGYVYEDNNRGYLNEVKITILEENTKVVIAEVMSNKDGLFNCWVPVNKDLLLRAEKGAFHTKEIPFPTLGKPMPSGPSNGWRARSN